MSTINVQTGVTGPFNTIVLTRKNPQDEFPEHEDPATVITRPGDLIERVPTGVRPHTTRGGIAFKRVAIEVGLIGKSVDDNYLVNDKVPWTTLNPGDVFQGRLKKGENVAKGDYLISYGDGSLCKAASSFLADVTAPSATVTNTVAETTFSNGTVTIPKNSVKAGDMVRIRGQVAIPSTNATDTLTIKIYLGATLVATLPALDVANSDIATFEVTLIFRTVGAAGTVYGFGSYTFGPTATATTKAFTLAQTAVDTTADQAITVTATWSVANAGNQAALQALAVEQVNAGTTPTAVGGGDIVGQVVNEAVNLSAASADGWVQCEVAG